MASPSICSIDGCGRPERPQYDVRIATAIALLAIPIPDGVLR